MGFASRRFVPLIAFLILLLAIPTLLHSQGSFFADDCADPQALFPRDADPLWDSNFREDERKQAYDNATQDRGEWAEGSTVMPGGTRVNWLIVRSYDPKRIYHRPGRNLLRGGQLGPIEIERVEREGMTIPIRWQRYESGVSMSEERVASAHVLVYRGEPIEDPYWAQILSAPVQLLRGRMPMTLYLAFSRVRPSEFETANADVKAWLEETVVRYPAACN